MKKKSIALSNTILSLQLKKALFLAFKEANKNETFNVDTLLLLFCILSVNKSLANKSLKTIFGSRLLIDEIKNKIILDRNKNSQDYKFSDKSISLSPSLRKLLFFLIRSSKTSNISVVTTLDVLKYLVRNKNIKKLLN